MALARQQQNALLMSILIAVLGVLVVLAGATSVRAAPTDVPQWVEDTLGPRNPELICIRVERWSEEMRAASGRSAQEAAVKIAKALLTTYFLPPSVLDGARLCELSDRLLDPSNGQEVLRGIVAVLLNASASPKDMGQTEHSLRKILLERSIRPEIMSVCGQIKSGELAYDRGRRYISALVTIAIEGWGFHPNEFEFGDAQCGPPARPKS